MPKTIPPHRYLRKLRGTFENNVDWRFLECGSRRGLYDVTVGLPFETHAQRGEPQGTAAVQGEEAHGRVPHGGQGRSQGATGAGRFRSAHQGS